MDGFDWEFEAARIDKALKEIADEDKRNGLDEALRQLFEEQKRRMDAFLKEQDAEAAKYLEALAIVRKTS